MQNYEKEQWKKKKEELNANPIRKRNTRLQAMNRL